MDKQDSLDKAATRLLKDHDKFAQLKEFGNRKNYPSKLKKLEERLISELELWERKGPSARLSDLQRDMQFVEKQKTEPFFDKERIDLLTNKYSISYGENRYTK